MCKQSDIVRLFKTAVKVLSVFALIYAVELSFTVRIEFCILQRWCLFILG